MRDDIIKLIRSLKYYQENIDNEEKGFKLIKEYKLSKSGRIDKTFQMIIKGIELYAKDEVEFNDMVERFYQMHKKYDTMITELTAHEEEGL